MKLIGMNKERVKLVNVLCLPSAVLARQISVSEKKECYMTQSQIIKDTGKHGNLICVIVYTR